MNPIAKIDYYTVILYKTTLRKVVAKFGLSVDDMSSFREFLLLAEPAPDNWKDKIQFPFPFGRVSVDIRDTKERAAAIKMIAADEDDNIFFDYVEELLGTVCHDIRIDAAGSELDAQRQMGFDVEAYAFDDQFWNDITNDWKVTRADFAFDFVDCEVCQDFPLQLCKELARCQLEDKLILHTGRSAGLKFTNRFGDGETCCYIGAMRSPEFLRVYDKMQEQGRKYKTSDSTLWPEDAQHRGCKSWFRLELQCRRDKACKQLFTGNPGTSPVDRFRAVAGHIIKNYSVGREKGQVFDCVQQLFNELSQNIKNLHFVQLDLLKVYKSKGTDLNGWLIRNLTALFMYMRDYGPEAVADMVNDIVEDLRESGTAYAQRKLQSMNAKMSVYEVALRKRLVDSEHNIVIDGSSYIRTAKRELEALGITVDP